MRTQGSQCKHAGFWSAAPSRSGSPRGRRRRHRRPTLRCELLSLTPRPAALLRRSGMAAGAAQRAPIANTAAGRGVSDSSSQRWPPNNGQHSEVGHHTLGSIGHSPEYPSPTEEPSPSRARLDEVVAKLEVQEAAVALEPARRPPRSSSEARGSSASACACSELP